MIENAINTVKRQPWRLAKYAAFAAATVVTGFIPLIGGWPLGLAAAGYTYYRVDKQRKIEQ